MTAKPWRRKKEQLCWDETKGVASNENAIIEAVTRFIILKLPAHHVDRIRRCLVAFSRRVVVTIAESVFSDYSRATDKDATVWW